MKFLIQLLIYLFLALLILMDFQLKNIFLIMLSYLLAIHNQHANTVHLMKTYFYSILNKTKKKPIIRWSYNIIIIWRKHRCTKPINFGINIFKSFQKEIILIRREWNFLKYTFQTLTLFRLQENAIKKNIKENHILQ